MRPGEFTYRPEHKPNQLICGKGQTAVITGWTVKKIVAKHLNPEDFAVIGQLYSPTRGINLLIRNLLLNPHVRFLVILNATREDSSSGSQRCLADFFQYGFEKGYSDTNRPCWVIRSSIKGNIDIEVDQKALETLREAIEWKEVETLQEAISATKYYASRPPVEPWGSPCDFPLEIKEPDVLPGELYGHRIEGKTIAETWVKIIHRIKTTGVMRPTGYDGQLQELINLMAVVTHEVEDPKKICIPDPNYLPCDQDSINAYLPQILEDSPVVEGVKYTYGQRLRSWFGVDQVEQVIEKLISEIDAASAVMSLWDVRDHEVGGSPCLNHIWLRVLEGELTLTALFRSNDMFSAWPANAFGLRALQKEIRDSIVQRTSGRDDLGKYKLKLGCLITISQSAHIYDDCWENAEQLINNQYAKILQAEMNAEDDEYYRDPAGNFIIEVLANKQQIRVLRTTPGNDGTEVKAYIGKRPLDLVRQICNDSPSIRPDHIGYLGIELQKARRALLLGEEYVQDVDTTR
ncbi:thymidylate synthase [Phormidium sp. FACHB-1136]|nr:thymidylate synthase [Phormidium sp. FACHB-1136]